MRACMHTQLNDNSCNIYRAARAAATSAHQGTYLKGSVPPLEALMHGQLVQVVHMGHPKEARHKQHGRPPAEALQDEPRFVSQQCQCR